MEEQGILVEGLAVVADEEAGDVDDAVEWEDGGGGVQGKAPAGGVGVAEAAHWVGGPSVSPLVRAPPSKSNLRLMVVQLNPIIIPVYPCRKTEEDMGWNPWQKVSASLSMARRTRRTRRAWRMWRTWNVEDTEDMEVTEVAEVAEDKKEVTLILL